MSHSSLLKTKYPRPRKYVLKIEYRRLVVAQCPILQTETDRMFQQTIDINDGRESEIMPKSMCHEIRQSNALKLI